MKHTTCILMALALVSLAFAGCGKSGEAACKHAVTVYYQDRGDKPFDQDDYEECVRELDNCRNKNEVIKCYLEATDKSSVNDCMDDVCDKIDR